ncbi:methyltransferase domain-containing protein [Caballeronia sp. Lep1P3]|uniref:methyltransferase domain-containing protein n=1 Tax=Caballeronia sp. Lep1P3 TaxID=2878150 RepID=UPI001FD03168|nr:methyltransferase domain-containing protein [Caballeronia sp. Lep1P3]
MNHANSEYWLKKAGEAYSDQQTGRAGAGNDSYRAQEAWLNDFFAQQAERLGRPVRVLEFGCGFGRFARLFERHERVRYHGYDFSATMVQPLFDNPPPGLAPLDERVRVAPTVGEAFPGEHFDVVFTVSVLIHNAPEQAARLIPQMMQMVKAHGSLCLIENALVPLTMKENNWHGGCWVHDFVGTTAPQYDVCVTYRLSDVHSVYRLGAPAAQARTVTLIKGDAPERSTTPDELKLLGMERLKLATALLENELNEAAALQAEAHDQGEFARYAEQRSARIQQGLATSVRRLEERLHGRASTDASDNPDDAHALIARLDQLSAEAALSIAQLNRAQTLRSTVTAALAEAYAESLPATPKEAPATVSGPQSRPHASVEAQQRLGPDEEFGWDRPSDVQWGHADERFSKVCHAMNVEWIGIRAAAAGLPGHKLVVSASCNLSAKAVDEIAQIMTSTGIDRLVVHGMSAPLAALISALKKSIDIPVFVVWHGAPVMWSMVQETELFTRVSHLLERGEVTRIAGMRSGMHPALGARAFRHQLFNLPPTLSESFGRADALLPVPERGDASGAVLFAPSWHVTHKNLPTNLIAANQTPKVAQVWTLDGEIRLPPGLDGKVRRLAPRSLRGMLDTMKLVDLVMNVSLVDCHPMIELEALAVRTPCLRGPLFMDALDDHPYVAATQVQNPLSVVDVMNRINAVLDIPRDDMIAMMSGYDRALREVSIARYCEFLEL